MPKSRWLNHSKVNSYASTAMQNQQRKCNHFRADYLFLVGHYPAFSFTKDNISSCLVPRLQDLMDKYNATAYISGHSHNLQVSGSTATCHSTPSYMLFLQHHTSVGKTGRVIHHVLSGAAHLINANKKDIFEYQDNPHHVKNEFFYPQKVKGVPKKNTEMGGVVYSELEKEHGRFEFYKCDGAFLYGFGVTARTTPAEHLDVKR